MCDLAHRSREGDQGGRYVEVLEGATHGVLAADGAHTQVALGHEGAEQRCDGLAPAFGHVS